ncbi:WD40 repeat-containing protein [Histoplasma capsulatum var. duboisii H88]|uniref:Pre-rRNA-processing protein IPI3 n=1 Tax=Ajellomyces capsulatus (strain H88) TaxID=544711 RepID=F0UQ48_AJEC8|nr:WD40 repeat-containing protein [Histoplasma capsulatum var. duboisii H88]QSS54044.1 WD domain-containing protein [Histoplasma capsulatum var. duboisii H88]
MLSESFVASFLTSNNQQISPALKDVGICLHEFQPSKSLRLTLKKSSTDPNGLAVGSSHIFASQAGKAVLHVYSREKNNQEATVPFPERIRSLALAGGFSEPGLLALGTEGGRLIIWETCTGRQISTTASHLQPVTSLIVDPTNNFIVSGSEDSNVHVWSIPLLTSFSRPSTFQTQTETNSPLRTFSHHRAPITSLAVGHSRSRNNIAISTSRDNTAIVWEYRSGKLLRTFLLPASPLCSVVDPADRAFYVGYDDGSVQMIDFFKVPSVQNILYDSNQQSTPSQLSANERWLPPNPDLGAVLCLTLSYDGTTLLSGHKSGAIACWDIAKGRYASTITTYGCPVTNLQMLTPTGFVQDRQTPKITVHNTVKPRYDHALSNSAQLGDSIPATYSLQAHLTGQLDLDNILSTDDFSEALTHPLFSPALISEGLAELAALEADSVGFNTNSARSQPVTYEPLDVSRLQSLEDQIARLKKQAFFQESVTKARVAEMVELRQHIASLEDQNSELHESVQKAQQARFEKQKRREERALRRREAWFEAEKNGQDGDALMREMEAEDEEETSGTDVMSSGDD